MESELKRAEMKIVDSTANPGAIGLLGFGMTTILLNLHNAGLFDLGSVVLSMGLLYGGIGQVIAGIMEWRKNNMFGATAFTSYGLFWISLVSIILMPKLGLTDKPDEMAMISFLAVWGLFSFAMFLNTMKTKKSLKLQFVFGTLVVLFGLLIAGDATGSTLIKHIAGYEGIVCGLSALLVGLEICYKEA